MRQISAALLQASPCLRQLSYAELGEFVFSRGFLKISKFPEELLEEMSYPQGF